MENLYKKYINNQLSKEDLDELKKDDFELHSQQIGEAMHEEWFDSEDDNSNISEGPITKIKKHLDNAIDHERSVTIVPFYYKVALWSAVVLLPLLIISSLYIYNEHSQSTLEVMTVVTHTGEKASVNLPDGTLVALNSDSRLSYIPKEYNKSNRTIDFEGEGYFKVSKDASRPFIVNAQGLRVKVLGTKFNLQVRKNKKNAELYLESGKVQFTSLKNNKSVVLFSNQKLTMNQMTGEMSVQIENGNLSTAWRRNEMVFYKTPFEEVAKCLENTYGITVQLNYRCGPQDFFTGTLVTNDLSSDIEVLEVTNGLTITKTGNTLYISRQH